MASSWYCEVELLYEVYFVENVSGQRTIKATVEAKDKAEAFDKIHQEDFKSRLCVFEDFEVTLDTEGPVSLDKLKTS